ncbi:hypothetical protein G7Y89_g9472 [Cudoniella acicularis]|uniref:DNA replication factor Cdt1 C-terminal domain-containing protein n=1 Tax=Cudoniella acicularis TaxID=354080 RepID=A0A8H4RG51_9HELO|nr:hypothetical protein G7Y89_g9472 [Cudoniella acicularis]
MPSAVKRQKLSTTRSASSSTRSRGLDAFTKVSKGNSVAKPVSEKKHGDTIAITILEKHSTITRKRKLVEVDEESDTEDVSEILSAAIKAKLLEERKAKPVQEIPQTPRKPILNTSPQSIETPTKGASTLLDRLFLSSKTPTRSPLNSNSSKISLLDSDTPPSSQDLPTELLDLINLHAAFLTALSLHYAHNGTYSPADLRNLCPNVARAWGKRSVTLEDIRRTLGIMNTQIAAGGKKDPRISQLTLSDYGHGKICIEIHFTGGKVGRIARPVNENLLNEIFVSGLKAPWESRTNDEMTMKEFIANLPMESITTCPSLLKMSPLLAKGQRRLEDLKAGVTIKKETEAKKAQEMATSYTSGTKPTLLERLRQKQQHLSTLPPPPSKEALARKAALQRIEEVAAVLTHLSTSSSIGQTRISFTLPTVLSKIRDSARNPMSKVEGADCVRLLASEIAPEWVNIMKMGGWEDGGGGC